MEARRSMRGLVAAAAVLAFALSGCPTKDGPMEEAGESMDEAVDDMKDAVD